MSLKHDSQNILAKTKRQAKMNSINKLCPLQYHITAPSHWQEIVLNNFGQHRMRWS